MKNHITLTLTLLFALLVYGCGKPEKVMPEPPKPVVELPEIPVDSTDTKDTTTIIPPKVDTTLYDTSHVAIAKGFEALLIKRGIIKDAVNDGYVIYKEIKDIDSVYLRAQLYDHYNFTSIRGIEYFKKLRYLNVYGSYLDSLDLRKNTRLEYLNCQGITGSGIQDNRTIRYINVTNCKELRHLDCAFNLLTKLDVTQNLKLETLICHRNSLTELNISNNPELRILDCRFNERITQLATDKTTELTKLAFAYNSISEPLIDKLTNLRELDCSFNISSNSFTTLSLENNVNLETLDISGSKLRQIDLSSNTHIRVFISYSGIYLKQIDFRPLSKLQKLICSYSLLESLNIDHNPELEILAVDGMKLETFDFSNNTKLKILECQHSPNLKQLNVNMCKEMIACIAHNCPNLKTICVDKIPDKNNDSWTRSEWTEYVTDCQ